MAAFRTGPHCQRQRNRTQNGRQRGHKNWPQTQRRRFNHRRTAFQAAFAQLVGELDDQDAILGDQPDQHHQTNLAVHVQRAASQKQRQQRPGHRQRYGQHDDQRCDEALELRRQHQIDKQQRQHKGHIQAGAGFAEFARLPIQRRGCIGTEHLGHSLIHEAQRLAQSIAGRHVGGNHRSALPVEVVEFLGRYGFAHVDQIGKLHQLALAATHEDRGQIGRALAILLLELHDHVILLAIALEAGDLSTAQQCFQGLADLLHIGANRGDLVALEHH